MAKLKLARKIAEATGRSVDEALRFVDEVGQPRARASLNSIEKNTPWKIPALAGIGVGGGLAYRQQDVETAQAQAREQEAEAEEAKTVRELLAEGNVDLARDLADDDGGGDDSGGDDLGGSIPFLDDLTGGGIEGMLFKLIVVVVVLNLVLNWSEGLGNEIEVGR